MNLYFVLVQRFEKEYLTVCYDRRRQNICLRRQNSNVVSQEPLFSADAVEFQIELDKQQDGVRNDQGERICWTTWWTTSQARRNKLEDGQTKDGPTRRFSVTDFWKRLPVDQDEADSIGSRKHVVKDAKLVLQLNIFQFLQICFMAV